MARNFNLLKPTLPPPNIWDQIYSWVLFNARIVVLLTELAIAVAFVGKIIVDTQAKNKDATIGNVTDELSFYDSTSQSLFNEIQIKSDKYVNIWDNASSYQKPLEEIFSYIPNPGPQISVNFSGSQVTVAGFTDLTSLQTLETSMKGSVNFSNVHISDLTLENNQVQSNSAQYVLLATIVNNKRTSL